MFRILKYANGGEYDNACSPRPGKFRCADTDGILIHPFPPIDGELPPVGSYYHTGFTGTAMWIDPVSGIYIIVLTNRVHPYGKGDAGPLRRQITELVAEALGPLSEGNILAKRPLLSGYYSKNGKVQTGIDVLRAEKLAPL